MREVLEREGGSEGIITLGTHVQRGLQYLVCVYVSVCPLFLI